MKSDCFLIDIYAAVWQIRRTKRNKRESERTMKKTTGHLLKRGDNFYVNWRFKGNAFLKVLRDENGNSITTERDAIKAKDKLMAPFAAGNEADALESIAGKLGGRKAELAKWEDEQHPPLSIGQAWSEFLASPNRPDSGKSTLRQYEFQWQAFADWMKEKHADVLTLRDVTKEIAEEYASSMNHGRFSPSTYNKHLNLLTLVFRVVKHKASPTSATGDDGGLGELILLGFCGGGRQRSPLHRPWVQLALG